ncbi:MAG: outer membrane beta-barrel protein [candidate division Zixibacteria bacterium]|nr:outer membrane beta-barrel protein [candidate division Zixibacteria bacterium]MBU1469479.1 outer membrane beta-barrel protein [candidate division Zixibacteria bacterium]MBU2624233.1 outer membrane beta-barrel protein [candidate division Zixibacteria bacterium]
MRLRLMTALLFTLLLQAAWAQDDSHNTIKGNRGNQLVGVRLGIYHFTSNEESIFGDNLISSSTTNNGFAAEVFFNYFFLDQTALEVSLGNANRGDILYENESIGRLFGSAGVYPMTLGLKITPLSGIVSGHYQPYIHGGGSLVVTREIFEGGTLYTDQYAYYDFGSKSRTAFGWWAGGGFESYVSSTIAVTSNFKYYSIDYSKYIAGYKDHSGYQISVGIAYIFRKK